MNAHLPPLPTPGRLVQRIVSLRLDVVVAKIATALPQKIREGEHVAVAPAREPQPVDCAAVEIISLGRIDIALVDQIRDHRELVLPNGELRFASNKRSDLLGFI